MPTTESSTSTWNGSVVMLAGFVIGSVVGMLGVATAETLQANRAVDWETLFAGGAGYLALLGAFATVMTMQRQIEADRKTSQEARARKARAARAMLPTALSECHALGRQTVSAYLSLHHEIRSESDTENPCATVVDEIGPIVIRISPQSIQTLKECIEHDDVAALPLTKLLRQYQIFEARFEDLTALLMGIKRDFKDQLNPVEAMIIDAADLMVRAGAMFEYSRGIDVSVPAITHENIVNTILFVSGRQVEFQHYKPENWRDRDCNIEDFFPR